MGVGTTGRAATGVMGAALLSPGDVRPKGASTVVVASAEVVSVKRPGAFAGGICQRDSQSGVGRVAREDCLGLARTNAGIPGGLRHSDLVDTQTGG